MCAAQGVHRIFPSASLPLPLESLCLSFVCFCCFPLWVFLNCFFIPCSTQSCHLWYCLIVTRHFMWMPLRLFFIIYCHNFNKVFCTLFTRLFRVLLSLRTCGPYLGGYFPVFSSPSPQYYHTYVWFHILLICAHGGGSSIRHFSPNLQNYLRNTCVPATSSPSERVFSACGNVVSCHRAYLKPETVDRFVFLAKNFYKKNKYLSHFNYFPQLHSVNCELHALKQLTECTFCTCFALLQLHIHVFI